MKKDTVTLFFVSVSLSFFLPMCAGAVTANITQLVFTSDIQQVEPNTISKIITVQTQNASGVSEDVDETNDVEFTSTSATGEFLNSTGSSVSTTMAKNSASRNFYYRDSASGEQTLTVKITGRTSGKSFSASQKITIGAGVSGGSGTSTTTTSQSTTTTTTSATETSYVGGGGGAYSSYTTITTVLETPPFEIGAGRARITTVGSPVTFLVQASPKSEITGGRFVWNFGDGTSAEGLKLIHTYAFPGEYAVILNGDRNGKEAVSRTTVKVTEPSLAIAVVPGGLKITNKSNTEINIGEWGVTDGIQTALIPRDTIILGNRSIIIPEQVLKVSLGSVSLLNSVKKVVTSISSPYGSVSPSITQGNSSEQFVVIQEKLENLKQTLLAIQTGKTNGTKNILNTAGIVHSSTVPTPPVPAPRATTTFFDRINHLFQTP